MTLIYEDLSYAVIGCAQRVHAELGPGFPEAVYHRALCLALAKAGIAFQSEEQFNVLFDGEFCGRFKADIYVDQKMIVELKATEALCSEHVAQTIAYLKASGAKLALLLNFGERSLRVKRLAN